MKSLMLLILSDLMTETAGTEAEPEPAARDGAARDCPPSRPGIWLEKVAVAAAMVVFFFRTLGLVGEPMIQENKQIGEIKRVCSLGVHER